MKLKSTRSLIDALDAEDGKGEEGIALGEELAGTGVVCNESSDDTEGSPCLLDLEVADEECSGQEDKGQRQEEEETNEGGVRAEGSDPR